MSISCFAAGASTPNKASELVTVAVSSNFLSTMKSIVAVYQLKTGKTVRLSGGSTGKHFAQLSHGAPYDVFFAADELRPKLLEERGLGIAGSRFTYALGLLVIWSPKLMNDGSRGGPLNDESAIKALFADVAPNSVGKKTIYTIALANPKLAPYGKAAQETLGTLSVKYTDQYRLIQGENIGQTYQFVLAGAADAGFLAYSQVLNSNKEFVANNYLLVPKHWYAPIKQQAIQFTKNSSTDEFLSFMKGKVAKRIILNSGYQVAGMFKEGMVEEASVIDVLAKDVPAKGVPVNDGVNNVR